MPRKPTQTFGARTVFESPQASRIWHVDPEWGRAHDTSGSGGASGGCRCGPRLRKECGRCDGLGCRACDDGLVDVEAFLPGDAGIVVHDAPGGACE